MLFTFHCLHHIYYISAGRSVGRLYSAGAGYYVPVGVAQVIKASHACFTDYTYGGMSNAHTNYDGTVYSSGSETSYFPVYGYGGSHLLSSGVIAWWGSRPQTLTTAVWMEDAAFGVWCEEPQLSQQAHCLPHTHSLSYTRTHT